MLKKKTDDREGERQWRLDVDRKRRIEKVGGEPNYLCYQAQRNECARMTRLHH